MFASIEVDSSFINKVINKQFIKMRIDRMSLAAYWVGRTVLEPLPPDIRIGICFLTILDAKCVYKTQLLPGSSPFLSLLGI